MADPMTPEREAQIREWLARQTETDDRTMGDIHARDLLAELDAIRMSDETTGGVLYDVIRRALAGDLDDHEAVRQIEQRLIHPLVAQLREARGRALGRRRRDTEVADLRAVLRELDVSDEQLHQTLQRIAARRCGAQQSRLQTAREDGSTP